MANKKSSKSPKTKTIKTQKVDHATHSSFGKLIAMLGLIIVMLLFGVFYLIGQRKTYMESQEILAFRSVVDVMIDEQFATEGERSAQVTGLGITDDKDLYADFIITKYEDHTPVAQQKARLHFQCQNLQPGQNCAHAYWYGDWEDIKE